MKTKTLLLASLLVAALTAQAQTVTTNTGATYKAEALKQNMLENATSINVSGVWTSDEIHNLGMALTMKDYPESSRNTSLTTAVFDKNAVIEGMPYLFYMFTALQTVTMPTVVNNAAVSFSNAFYGCTSLTSVDLSSFTNIVGMSYAFCRCKSLTDVKLSTNEHTINEMMSFEQAFYGCSSLTSKIDLSGFMSISNMTSVFEGCKKLTTVKMPAQTSSTEEIDLSGAFYDCSLLTSTIDLRAFTHVRGYADVFYGCSKLTEIHLGSATSSNESMSDTFAGCTKECKVYLPEGVTEVPAAWQNAPVTFMINGEPVVAISTTPTGVTKIPAISRVYSIDGRLVKTVPATEYSTLKDGLDRGIYIVNGEKMMVE